MIWFYVKNNAFSGTEGVVCQKGKMKPVLSNPDDNINGYCDDFITGNVGIVIGGLGVMLGYLDGNTQRSISAKYLDDGDVNRGYRLICCENISQIRNGEPNYNGLFENLSGIIFYTDHIINGEFLSNFVNIDKIIPKDIFVPCNCKADGGILSNHKILGFYNGEKIINSDENNSNDYYTDNLQIVSYNNGEIIYTDFIIDGELNTLVGGSITFEDNTHIPKFIYDIFNIAYDSFSFNDSVHITLYDNRAESSRVNKSSFLTPIRNLIGTFRDDVDITRPSITIQFSGNTVDFNYLFISELNRYYFVDNVIIVNKNIRELQCHIDILNTYREYINGLNAFIDRNEYADSPLIIDNKRIIHEGYDIETKSVDNAVFFMRDTSFTTPYYNFVANGIAIYGDDYSDDTGGIL